MKTRKKRLNTYFRQTVKSFKAARQAQVFGHINRNIPYRIYKMTKEQFNSGVQKINRKFSKGSFKRIGNLHKKFKKPSV